MTFKPNYRLAEREAYRILLKSGLNRLPINTKKICRMFPDLELMTYSEFIVKWGISIEEVCEWLESDEAACMYWKEIDKYMIIYNEKFGTKERLRWTLAHELGHYILKHHKKTNKAVFSRSSLSEQEYEMFEKEADCFARSLLAPPSILSALKKFNVKDLSEWCSLSKKASLNTYRFFNKGIIMGRRYNPNDRLINQFKDYIFNINNERQCKRCRHVFIHINPNYCPICGHKKLSNKKGEKVMIYSGYELSEDGRALICPQCQNEEITKGSFCKICGIHIINRCDNRYYDMHGYEVITCDEIAEGNARYCVQCGHETTFNKNNLLDNWKTVLDSQSKFNDDDLPF